MGRAIRYLLKNFREHGRFLPHQRRRRIRGVDRDPVQGEDCGGDLQKSRPTTLPRRKPPHPISLQFPRIAAIDHLT
jgi:hypothetical protein